MEPKIGNQVGKVYSAYSESAFTAASRPDPRGNYFWGSFLVGLKENPGLTLEQHKAKVASFTA